MQGNVFHIQKFSIHDGPGIRTTVFLKGCPLRCKWCSNPESQESARQITIDLSKCIGCRSCEAVCRTGSITWHTLSEEKGEPEIHTATCCGCLSCVNACKGKALKAEGEMAEVGRIVDMCLQDMDFYEESGGGVTLSGGECLMQPAFVQELICQLKAHRIHVAAETTGYVSENVFRQTAPLFDLLLFDVKHYDSEKHFQGTGVHNESIIVNLKWAKEQGLAVLPRIPVIPGFNDRMEDAAGIAGLLKQIGFDRAQLLAFHQMGERKYELLRREYAMKNVKALHPEDLTAYRQVFLDAGISCWI